MNKITTTAAAALMSMASFASSTVMLERVQGNVSKNKVKIAYNIANPGGCEQLAITIWADENRKLALYEKFLDEAGKYATGGKHTVTFTLNSATYSLSQIKNLFPDAIVEVYADFCGDEDDDYDPTENTEDSLKLVYTASESAAPEIPEITRKLYGSAQSWTTILSRNGEDASDTFDAYGLVKIAISRHNSKGQVKIKMAVKTFFGSMAQGSAVVKPDEDGSLEATIRLEGFGTFAISGEKTNDAYRISGIDTNGMYEFDDVELGGEIACDTICFDFDPADLPEFVEKDVIEEALPLDYKISIEGGNILNCGKAPRLAFSKASSVADNTLPKYGNGWVLTGVEDASSPNTSSLALKYAIKSGVFQGRFKVYYTNAGYTSGKPKAKGITATVRGAMTKNGIGYGMAGMKISGVKYFFPVTIWRVDSK